MIVLRIHYDDGIEYFLASARANPKHEPLIITVFFELFHDQFVGITATAVYILLCFENRILCSLPRAMDHEWHEFPLDVLVTRLQGRGRPLKLGKRIEGLVKVTMGHIVNILLFCLCTRGHQGHLGDR